jgi:undecaprenyl-diphosphatase
MWLAVGIPAALVIAFVVVKVTDSDPMLFFLFNRISIFTPDAMWVNLTVLGDGLFCAVILLPWLRVRPDRIWGGLLGALLVVAATRIPKAMIESPRPLGVLPEDMVLVLGPGYVASSFPSGHTATFWLVVGILVLTSRNWGMILAALLMGKLVAWSRIAVGVHWPTDVLAGAAIGWVCAWIGLLWIARTRFWETLRAWRIIGVLLLIAAAVMAVIDHTGYPGVLWFQRVLALGCLTIGAVELRRGWTTGPVPVWVRPETRVE